MNIYISGPVTGFEKTARKRFKKAEREIFKKFSGNAGVIDPFAANARIFRRFAEKPTHGDYMAASIAMLSVCDGIYLMRGWQKSKGCRQEFEYAVKHRYKIIFSD